MDLTSLESWVNALFKDNKKLRNASLYYHVVRPKKTSKWGASLWPDKIMTVNGSLGPKRKYTADELARGKLDRHLHKKLTPSYAAILCAAAGLEPFNPTYENYGKLLDLVDHQAQSQEYYTVVETEKGLDLRLAPYRSNPARDDLATFVINTALLRYILEPLDKKRRVKIMTPVRHLHPTLYLVEVLSEKTNESPLVSRREGEQITRLLGNLEVNFYPYVVAWSDFASRKVTPKTPDEKYFANYSSDEHVRRKHAGRVADIIKNAIGFDTAVGTPYQGIRVEYQRRAQKLLDKINERIDGKK